MNKQREKFEKETKDMSLEEKLNWVEDKIFWIAIDNYIEDKKAYSNYIEIRDELKALIKVASAQSADNIDTK